MSFDAASTDVTIPEFQLPYPLRVNPHLESVVRGCETWAGEMGMLAGGPHPASWAIWDLKKYHAMELAKMTAYIHPDASLEELSLLHECYVWILAFDDHFANVFKVGRDAAAAAAHVARLSAFTRLDPAEPTPEPTNAVELGLADVWRRMGQGRSPEWRRRFADAIGYFAEGSLWELSCICEGRTPDPFEYATLRRMAYAGRMGTYIVEHGRGAEIPPEVVHSRPVQMLIDAWIDAEMLHNDMHSSPREINEEGETSNAIQVFSAFLKVGFQQSVDAIDGLIRSRMARFERIVQEELPLLARSRGLDEAKAADLTSWAQGMRYALNGTLAWQLEARRYRER